MVTKTETQWLSTGSRTHLYSSHRPLLLWWLQMHKCIHFIVRQEVTHVIAKARHTTAARAGKYMPGPLRQTLIPKEGREGAVVYSSYYRTRGGYAQHNPTNCTSPEPTQTQGKHANSTQKGPGQLLESNSGPSCYVATVLTTVPTKIQNTAHTQTNSTRAKVKEWREKRNAETNSRGNGWKCDWGSKKTWQSKKEKHGSRYILGECPAN